MHGTISDLPLCLAFKESTLTCAASAHILNAHLLFIPVTAFARREEYVSQHEITYLACLSVMKVLDVEDVGDGDYLLHVDYVGGERYMHMLSRCDGHVCDYRLNGNVKSF